MELMFSPGSINGMELANRFVRSATWEGMAGDDGSVTPGLISVMTDLVNGGVGLVITGHAYVLPRGQAGPWQLGIYSDNLKPGLASLTHAVHTAGGRVVAQLAHSGNFAPENLTGKPPLVVSQVPGLTKEPCDELTESDIREIVSAYALAAQRAKDTGFDGVQLHSAHGYLLSQFLSPLYNRRSDAYGGSLENRCRIHREILDAIQDRVGSHYPVLMKINCRDFTENGLSADDSLAVCRILAGHGLHAVELSGGTLTGGKLSPSRTGITSAEKEAYFRQDAARFKKELGIPLILVGGIRSPEVARELLESGTADYISMCRPLIREPGLINRWKSGDLSPAACLSDNLCFRPAMTGKGVHCVVEKRLEKS